MRALLHWYFAPQKHLSPRDQRWYAIQLRSLPLGGAVHLALIALFTAVGVPVLAWLNAASAVVYAIASVACRLGRHRIAFWLMGLELIVHAWIGVRQIGWATGVSYPLFLLPLLSGPMSMPGDRRTVGITPGDRRALSILGGGTLLVLRDAGAPAVVLDDRVVFVMFSLSILTVFAFTRTVVAVLEGTATRLETELLRERAKSEGLLKDELSHQITARSRELGRMLASADATLVPGRPRVGERFGERYRVERELGAGAMGAVFEVVRVTDDRRLALKVVTGEVSADRAARFAREAEIGARVRHANLVEIVDVGVAAGGVPYLAMELAPAGSLETCRERFGDVRWARPLLLGIARGLSALHEAGVVHRDLKPANVLVIGEDQAKISDFGISRFGELDPSVDPAGSTLAASRPQALTATGMLLGTPYYMAPEAVRGAKVESSADVFAFGILAVEMLTGCAPFVTPPMFRVLAGEKLEEPRGLDAIEPRLRELLTACLAEAPTSRPTIRMILDVLAG